MIKRAMQSHLATLAFCGLGIVWGLSFVIIKFIVTSAPPFFVVSVRMFVATGILALVARYYKTPLQLPRNQRLYIWGTGILSMGLPFALLFWGQRGISAGLGGILNGLVPLFNMGFILSLKPRSHWPKPLWRTQVALVMGFLGLIAIFYPQLTGVEAFANYQCTLAVVLMSACYGLTNVLNTDLMADGNRGHLIRLVYHQHFSSAVFLALLSLMFEDRGTYLSVLMDKQMLGLIFYMALIPSTAAMLAQFALLQRWGSVKTSAVTYIIPIAALFFDYIFFGVSASTWSIAGLFFIFAGLKLLSQTFA